MSSYYQITKHPDTGKWERAAWLDDYFGRRNYGVEFPDGKVFDVRKVGLVTKNEQKR